MASIRDKSTIEIIAKTYCSNGRIKSLALQGAGYSKLYSERAGLKLFGNVQLIDAISRIDAKTAVKLDHDRTIAIKILNEALAIARDKHDSAGIVQACRELDAISNLHSNTIVNKGDVMPAIDAALSDELAGVAERYKLRIANS